VTADSRKIRVLYVVRRFPQLSETYIKNEIEALGDAYEVRVISLNRYDTPYGTLIPWERTDDQERMVQIAREFRPDVLHGHFLTIQNVLHRLAARLGVPYTIRSHSFDALGAEQVKVGPIGYWRRSTGRQLGYRDFALDFVVPMINDDSCLGVLAFPFVRPRLTALGVRDDKLVDCHPVIPYRRFLDRGPNGDDILNMGACHPKKRMEDFVDLAALLPEKKFSLYAIGYQHKQIEAYNAKHGSPVEMAELVPPDAMPAVYKRHRWLVYTADRIMNKVGWPVAVPEAQAAGVGVCMPNLRPDIRDLLGDAGFVYDSLAEVKEIISRPPPEAMRELGFEVARRSDIETNIRDLTALWERAIR